MQDRILKYNELIEDLNYSIKHLNYRQPSRTNYVELLDASKMRESDLPILNSIFYDLASILPKYQEELYKTRLDLLLLKNMGEEINILAKRLTDFHTSLRNV